MLPFELFRELDALGIPAGKLPQIVPAKIRDGLHPAPAFARHLGADGLQLLGNQPVEQSGPRSST